MRDRIKNRVIALVRKISDRSIEISSQSHLFDDAGLDSISSIQLVVEIEQIYGIDIMEQVMRGEVQYVDELIQCIYIHKI
ncbi:hypothetical protein IDH44_19875 [Paenibacillus sp. IB182496]|uniref:Carrier domain-containing protein n=1 Tax=Paenibacillus sabuli TaxID=2772509 RepID=A0A927BXZ2_9BACL|nr:acyl carrier protein [Paenibacillus sabuli]MBD2847464.1 hypothetical protein [Paenibacillus sabuli]